MQIWTLISVKVPEGSVTKVDILIFLSSSLPAWQTFWNQDKAPGPSVCIIPHEKQSLISFCSTRSKIVRKTFWKDYFAIRLAEWTIVSYPALLTKIIDEGKLLNVILLLTDSMEQNLILTGL